MGRTNSIVVILEGRRDDQPSSREIRNPAMRITVAASRTIHHSNQASQRAYAPQFRAINAAKNTKTLRQKAKKGTGPVCIKSSVKNTLGDCHPRSTQLYRTEARKIIRRHEAPRPNNDPLGKLTGQMFDALLSPPRRSFLHAITLRGFSRIRSK